MTDTAENPPPAAKENGTTTTTTVGGNRIRFDTSRLSSSYCNVCNANSTREEVVLNFGLNQSWDLHAGDVEVQLLHRIILSPPAAKRLQDLLTRLMAEYETRYGTVR